MRKANLFDHRIMKRALADAYDLGVYDYKKGRVSPRTGRSISVLICAGTPTTAHQRQLKHAYQAAKFNCSMGGK